MNWKRLRFWQVFGILGILTYIIVLIWMMLTLEGEEAGWILYLHMPLFKFFTYLGLINTPLFFGIMHSPLIFLFGVIFYGLISVAIGSLADFAIEYKLIRSFLLGACITVVIYIFVCGFLIKKIGESLTPLVVKDLPYYIIVGGLAGFFIRKFLCRLKKSKDTGK